MPTFLLIGIPIVVGILLWGILSLPDEEEKSEEENKKEPVFSHKIASRSTKKRK